MVLASGEYYKKNIFDIKIKLGILEIYLRPNFNKFWVFLILGPILGLKGGKCFIKIIFDF